MTDERSKTDVSSDEVIRKYFDMVYKLALSQTKNQTFAEDVTQDVFVRFIQNKDKFESKEHIKAWLIRVTINCSKSVFMSSWFKKTVPLEEDLTFDSPEKSNAERTSYSTWQYWNNNLYCLYNYKKYRCKDPS